MTDRIDRKNSVSQERKGSQKIRLRDSEGKEEITNLSLGASSETIRSKMRDTSPKAKQGFQKQPKFLSRDEDIIGGETRSNGTTKFTPKKKASASKDVSETPTARGKQQSENSTDDKSVTATGSRKQNGISTRGNPPVKVSVSTIEDRISKLIDEEDEEQKETRNKTTNPTDTQRTLSDKKKLTTQGIQETEAEPDISDKGAIWQMVYEGLAKKNAIIRSEMLKSDSGVNKLVDTLQTMLDITPVSSKHTPHVHDIKESMGVTTLVQIEDVVQFNMNLEFIIAKENKNTNMWIFPAYDDLPTFVGNQSCKVDVSVNGKMGSYLGMLSNYQDRAMITIMKDEANILKIGDLVTRGSDGEGLKVRIMINSSFLLKAKD